jgi:hypothetical protein
MIKETFEELLLKESLHRTSQNNFNQASAGYNAKWFRRGGLFGAELQKQESDKEIKLLKEELEYEKRKRQ